jgi:hypothetical protein
LTNKEFRSYRRKEEVAGVVKIAGVEKVFSSF